MSPLRTKHVSVDVTIYYSNFGTILFKSFETVIESIENTQLPNLKLVLAIICIFYFQNQPKRPTSLQKKGKY